MDIARDQRSPTPIKPEDTLPATSVAIRGSVDIAAAEKFQGLIEAVDTAERSGQMVEAAKLAREAEQVGIEAFGADHPKVVQTILTSVELEERLGNIEDAEGRLFEVGIKLQHAEDFYNTPGRYDRERAQVWRMLGRILASDRSYTAAPPEERFKQAGVRLKNAYDICLQPYIGERSVEMAQSLFEKAQLNLKQGKVAEAKALLQEADQIFQANSIGVGDPHVRAYAECLNVLAGVYLTLNDFKSASDCATRASTLRMNTLAPGHPEMAESLLTFAQLNRNKNEDQKALQCCKLAAQIFEESFSTSHVSVLRAKVLLASLLIKSLRREHSMGTVSESQTTLDEAQKLLKEVLHVEQESPPKNPIVKALALRSMGDLYQTRGLGLNSGLSRKDINEAEKYYEAALTLAEQVFGKRNLLSQVLSVSLAQNCIATNRLTEAAIYLERGIEILRECLGRDHPTNRSILEFIVRTYLANGEPSKAALWKEQLDEFNQRYPQK